MYSRIFLAYGTPAHAGRRQARAAGRTARVVLSARRWRRAAHVLGGVDAERPNLLLHDVLVLVAVEDERLDADGVAVLV